MYRFRCPECNHEVDIDDFGEGEYSSSCQICGRKYIIKNEFQLITKVYNEMREEIEV